MDRPIFKDPLLFIEIEAGRKTQTRRLRALPDLLDEVERLRDAILVIGKASEEVGADNRRLLGELAEARADNARLHATMEAAADEIDEHWDAHCDADGAGPVGLVRHLREGPPTTDRRTEHDHARLAAAEAKRERRRLSRGTR